VESAPEPIIVPYTELAPDVLHAVVESFVLREGTDYGEKEISLEAKVARVLAQLKLQTGSNNRPLADPRRISTDWIRNFRDDRQCIAGFAQTVATLPVESALRRPHPF